VQLPQPLDLAATLHGGQAFRWRRDGATWAGVIGGVAATITDNGSHRAAGPAGQPVEGGGRKARKAGNAGIPAFPNSPLSVPRLPDIPGHPRGPIITGPSDAAVRRYFRFEPEDDARRERLAQDDIVAPALAAHAGLRLLRQDPWETTVAFVTSANNNILRIEGILDRMCAKWGAPLEFGQRRFPDAGTLSRARVDSLRAVGLGYRAPFVRDAARMVARGDVDLASLRGASADDAREVLLRLPGVGPKVADCIALFSLDVDDAFPVDRWVLRAMGDAFFDGEEKAPREVVDFARARWGRDAGLAQQVLFHAARVRDQAPGTKRLSSTPAP
jgi:N-glycosylase/DNA lyase